MREKTLDDIKLAYKRLPSDANEETVKIKIILEFLNLLNYNSDDFSYEVNPNKKYKDKRVDIGINIRNKEKDTFYIEIKGKNLDLFEEDIRQINSYLHDKNISWGLLTNGNHYILVNDKLDTLPDQKIVLEYFLVNIPTNVSKRNNKLMYEFLTLDSLFIKRTTNYYLNWKEFDLDVIDKSGMSNSSKLQYWSAYNMFVKYLISSFDSYDLNYFSISNFKKFINYLNNKKDDKLKKDSVLSKYNYILKFVNYLEDTSKISLNSFKNFDIKNYITEIDLKRKKKTNELYLENIQIEAMLNNYNDKSNSSRNKLIFILILLGFKINEIINLKESDINFKKNIIEVNKKTYLLTEPMKCLVNNIIKEKKKLKIKCSYIFCTKYDSKYDKLTRSTFHNIVNNKFDNLNLEEDKKKQLNMQFIRQSIIRKLYESGFSLEELSYLFDLNISSIIKHIDENLIIKRAEKAIPRMYNKHPYKEFFQ
ncbi:type I restriction enzyme HsdR N-terminal domain-containing protein [uncultured Clostridium sp.]|uniref:type I restriction enzyme HsdR N-terminal domain-containing protein n=1 Tax=uncultured Clostridium sp. TaxID=59620 RepID=UPI0028EC08CE|nr:type I restriction enzyme HsdR N-terminal domain-containing protein [uncultured Clostridium sp.]